MTTAQWRTLTGEPIAVRVDDTRRDDSGVVARLALDWADWRCALACGAFHLDGVAQPPSFQPDREVIVRARLREAPARHAGADLDHVLAAMTDPASPLSHTEAWLCVEVTQSVPMPEGHADLGARTPWAALGTRGEPVDAPGAGGDLVALVTGVLSGLSLSHEILDEDLVRFTVRDALDEARSWRVLIPCDREARVGAVISSHPARIPVAARAGLALLLLEANNELGIGAFEIDADDGEVRYRLGFERPTPSGFADVLDVNLTVMSQYFDAIALAASPDSDDGSDDGSDDSAHSAHSAHSA